MANPVIPPWELPKKKPTSEIKQWGAADEAESEAPDTSESSKSGRPLGGALGDRRRSTQSQTPSGLQSAEAEEQKISDTQPISPGQPISSDQLRQQQKQPGQLSPSAQPGFLSQSEQWKQSKQAQANPSLSSQQGVTQSSNFGVNQFQSGQAQPSQADRVDEIPKTKAKKTKSRKSAKVSEEKAGRTEKFSKLRSSKESSNTEEKKSKSAADTLVDGVEGAIRVAMLVKDVVMRNRLPSTVLMVDETRLLEVKFKSGQVLSVVETEHPDSLAALKVANSTRGNNVIVWCGPAVARLARPMDTTEHADAVPLADAQYLMKVFGESVPSVMRGVVAMAPVSDNLELANYLATMKTPMTISAMCVDMRKDGIWLRVGRSSVEATLVNDNEIGGWTVLCKGLDAVSEKIRQGQPVKRARIELAEQVANETRRRIMQWQRNRTVPSQIWLHGPGGDSSGEIYDSLIQNSGCRVTGPTLGVAASIDAMRFTPLLPAAESALYAPRLRRPSDILTEFSRDKRRLVIKLAVGAIAILFGMTVVSANQGNNLTGKLKDRDNELTQLAQEYENRSTLAQWAAIKPDYERRIGVVDENGEIVKVGEPRWAEAFAFYNRFKGVIADPSVVASFNGGPISLKLVVHKDNRKDVEKELGAWAKVLYGEDGVAKTETALSDVYDDDGDQVDINATLSGEELE